MESVLVTGASGFIGSFIVEEALRRGFGVWAGIRSSSSREYLQDRKIHFLELDFAHPNELRAQLSGHKGTYSKFDYIIHCAGVTKCVDKSDFERVNYLQTKYFIDTLRELNMIPKQFIFISTLSVFGPIREKNYTPITEEDTPMPNTAYGLSKLKAEIYLQSIPGFPLRHLSSYGCVRSARERLFPDGKVHPSAHGLFRRFPPAGFDVCLRQGYCAGRFSGNRETSILPHLFPGRRQGVPEPCFFRSDTERTGESVCNSLEMSINYIESCIFARRILGETPEYYQYAQFGQV